MPKVVYILKNLTVIWGKIVLYYGELHQIPLYTIFDVETKGERETNKFIALLH